jgi:NACHT domain
MNHFEEILSTLGAKNIKTVANEKTYSCWRVEFVTPAKTVIGNYLYLKSSFTNNDVTISRLREFDLIFKNEDYQIVFPQSSDFNKNKPQTKAKFQKNDIFSTTQLLEDNVLSGIKYLKLQAEEHFLSPTITNKDGNVVQDGLLLLTNWLGGEGKNSDSDSIGMLIANGGIGKTTLTRQLCNTVHAKYPHVFPLLIESEHWKSLNNSNFSIDTLWEIAISTRLSNCQNIRANKSAIKVLMQEGLLVIIFDGFDELATSTLGRNSAKEMLEELEALLIQDNEKQKVKILLTTRTSYWEGLKLESEVSKNITEFKLNGFDNEQRKSYFRKRFTDQVKIDTALRLSKEVNSAIYKSSQINNVDELNSDRLNGTPFVLSLIAQFLQYEDNLNPYGFDPLEPILLGIFKRENIRQELNINPEIQLQIFEEIARLPGTYYKINDIDMILTIYGVDDIDVKQRFIHHFLFNNRDEDYLSIRYEILKIYFIARFLASGLINYSNKTPQREVANVLAESMLQDSQVLDWVANQFLQLDFSALIKSISNAFAIINRPENHVNKQTTSSSLFALIMKLIKSDNKKDRAAELYQLISSIFPKSIKIYNNVLFSNSINNIDFTDTSFEKCTFIDTNFFKCKFSNTTKFISCTFKGSLDFSHCEYAQDIYLSETHTVSNDAQVTINNLKKIPTSNEIKNQNADEILRQCLRKFKGIHGLDGIQKIRRNNGLNIRNIYYNLIWKALLDHQIVCTHDISGVSDGGYHISDDIEIRKEIVRFLDNGMIGINIKKVIDFLKVN